MIERSTKGIEVSPGTNVLHVLTHLLQRGIAGSIGKRSGGQRVAVVIRHLLAGTEVDEPTVTISVLHDVAWLQVQMVQMLSMHILQRTEHLREDGMNTGGVQRSARSNDLAERLPAEELHHVVGCIVLLKEIHHLDNVRMVKLNQPLRLGKELTLHAFKVSTIVLDTDSDMRVTPRIDTTHKKLFHSHVLVKAPFVLHLVGVAKTARCQVAHYTVFTTLKQSALRQHLHSFVVSHTVFSCIFSLSVIQLSVDGAKIP